MNRGPVFESEIQPVLADRCGKCHSDKVQKGGLDLSLLAGIRQGGESGEAAVRDTVDDSLLWKMIDGGDMPPVGQDPLTADERELIRRWIAVRQRMEPPLEIRALWDRGDPSPTYILRRGEYDKPGHLVGPGVPSVLTDGQTPFVSEPPFPGGTPKTGRRLAFARWLIQPDLRRRLACW